MTTTAWPRRAAPVVAATSSPAGGRVVTGKRRRPHYGTHAFLIVISACGSSRW